MISDGEDQENGALEAAARIGAERTYFTHICHDLPHAETCAQLPAGVELVTDPEQAVVTGFAIDHRKVAPGTVFGAFAGARVNGEDFIPAAIAGGAIAVVAVLIFLRRRHAIVPAQSVFMTP